MTERGNEPAQAVIQEVFAPVDRAWRGIGVIPASGWKLSGAYREFDAERRKKAARYLLFFATLASGREQ